jgi:hypothetical protein
MLKSLIACLLLRLVSGIPIVGLTELAARGNPLWNRLFLGFVYVKTNTDGGDTFDKIINESKEDGYLIVHRERLASNLVSSGEQVSCSTLSRSPSTVPLTEIAIISVSYSQRTGYRPRKTRT